MGGGGGKLGNKKFCDRANYSSISISSKQSLRAAGIRRIVSQGLHPLSNLVENLIPRRKFRLFSPGKQIL